MDTDTSPRYTIIRNVVISVCAFLIFVSIVRSCTRIFGALGSTPAARTPAAPAPAGYNQRFCSDIQLRDLTAKNPDSITIALKTGCFGVRVKTPVAWASYFIQKSQENGDWAVVWCNGRPSPNEPRPYYEDMGNAFANCREGGEPSDDFYLQGHGTISFRRVQTASGYEAKLSTEEVESTYKLTPTPPTSGADSDYTFIIEECHRAAEQILCSGKATNKTDARTELLLHGGTSVDDEGNTVRVSMAFPGSDAIYGWSQYLLPDVPTNFTVTIADNHQKAKTLNLELQTNWQFGGRVRYETLIYKDVPIQ